MTERVLIKTATLDVGDFRINAAVARDADGKEFLLLSGVDCDLDGAEPGLYYPVEPHDPFCPHGIPPEFCGNCHNEDD